jgi:integrase
MENAAKFPSAGELYVLQSLAEKYPWLLPKREPDRTCRQVCNAYLDAVQTGLANTTLLQRTAVLNRFLKTFGDRVLRECSPVELEAWIRDQPGWGAHTRHHANTAVQRAFNWAVKGRLIKENPFKGASFRAGQPRREMTAEEYRTILRHAPTMLKHVLIMLRYTGMRPCELRELRWSDIDWDRRVIMLKEHKTSHTQLEPKPRLIPLTPKVWRLLLLRSRRQCLFARPEVAAALIREFLRSHQPVLAPDFHEWARKAGLPVKNIYHLAAAAGAHSRAAPPGPWVWELDYPADHGLTQRPHKPGYYCNLCVNGKQIQKKLADDRDEAIRLLAEIRAQKAQPEVQAVALDEPGRDRGHVFTSHSGKPWTKNNLTQEFMRLRRKIGMAESASLYGLRHKFFTDGVRNGVHLKVLATLGGHTTTAMIDRVYCHIGEDVSHLREAMEQVTKQGPKK